jgi:hypothetical protein
VARKARHRTLTMATGTPATGVPSEMVRSSQLEGPLAAQDTPGPRLFYATIGSLKVVTRILEALKFKDVRSAQRATHRCVGWRLTACAGPAAGDAGAGPGRRQGRDRPRQERPVVRVPDPRVRPAAAAALADTTRLMEHSGRGGAANRLFRQYEVGAANQTFGISMTSLLQCLQLLSQTDVAVQGPSVVELRMSTLEDGLHLLYGILAYVIGP